MTLPADLFERALTEATESVCITDGELNSPGPTITFVNAAFEQLTGYPAAEVLGRSPRLLQGELTDRRVLSAMRTRLDEGGRFTAETINYRRDGSPFVMNWSIAGVHDAAGLLTHYVAFQRDVTELRLLQRLRSAHRKFGIAALRLTEDSDPDELLPALISELLATLAEFLYVGRPTVVTRRRTGWHVSPTPESGEGRVHVELSRTHPAPTIVEIGDDRAYVVPLGGGGSGSVIVDGVSEASTDLLPLEHLADLASAAGRSIDSLNLMVRRRQETLAVQRVLLPPADFATAGYSVHAHYVPSRQTERAGGDWYDVVETPNAVRAVVGDVVGKGLLAAAEMGLVRSHLRALLSSGMPIQQAFLDADDFCRGEGLMATAAFADVARDSGKLEVLLAGHPPPVIIDRATATVLRAGPAPPLGAFRSPPPPPPTTLARLAPSAMLLLYTDGAIDERATGAADATVWLEALLSGVGSGQEVIDRVVAGAEDDRIDDLALLVLQRID